VDWYEDEVRTLERTVHDRRSTAGPVVFYGGSSIRLWETLDTDFPGVGTINLGFGGATLAACVFFFGRLVAPCGPRSLVVYAGDNDLGDGRSPADVLASFRELADLVSALPGGPRLSMLSIKPSPARWYLIDAIREANRMIRQEVESRPSTFYLDVLGPMLDPDGRPRPELYADDGLHLSVEGYRLWRTLIAAHADTVFSRIF
jgi:lysophospholipase L1-like esterase